MKFINFNIENDARNLQKENLSRELIMQMALKAIATTN